jgi:hypothetical protein
MGVGAVVGAGRRRRWPWSARLARPAVAGLVAGHGLAVAGLWLWLPAGGRGCLWPCDRRGGPVAT